MSKRAREEASPDYLALPDIWQCIWAQCDLAAALAPVCRRWRDEFPRTRIHALVAAWLPCTPLLVSADWLRDLARFTHADALQLTRTMLASVMFPLLYLPNVFRCMVDGGTLALTRSLFVQTQKLCGATRQLRAHAWKTIDLPDRGVSKMRYVYLLHNRRVLVPFGAYRHALTHRQARTVTVTMRRSDALLCGRDARELNWYNRHYHYTSEVRLCRGRYALDSGDWDTLEGLYWLGDALSLEAFLNTRHASSVARAEAIDALARELVDSVT